jgi:hypothetical protein
MTTIQIKVPNWLDFIFTCPLLAYRLVRYGYTYRRIYLGEGKFTIVEPVDFYWLNNFHWYGSGKGECFYATRATRTNEGKSKTVYLHREIMKPPKGLLVDHINGDGLDNRRDNLRVATHSQNSCNRRKQKNTTSKFIGAHLDKRTSRWIAQIMYQRKMIHLGTFDNEIDAARAYDAAAKKYHGEFARLNFPEETSNVLK